MDKEKIAGIAPFQKIASFGKLSLLNNNKESKKIITENLYWNGI